MGTAQPGEDPKTMTNVAKLATEDRSEARRRLHLRDITNELPTAAETVGFRSAGRARTPGRGFAVHRPVAAHSPRADSKRLKRAATTICRAAPMPSVSSAPMPNISVSTAPMSSNATRRRSTARRKRRKTSSFPKLSDEARLPRGTFLIIGLIVAVGIYGGYLLTRSADRMMAERVPPVPARIEARVASADAPDERPAGLSGDPASAATRPASDASAAQILGAGDPASVYAVPPQPAAPASADVAALAPQPATGAPPSRRKRPPSFRACRPIPDGQAYGLENTDARVVVRARKNEAWIRIEDAQGHVLIERTMKTGDSYRVPGKPGVILVARDASAFEILVDNASLGLAGPPTLVLTGKSLDADDLIAAMPRPAPTPADEAAAAARRSGAAGRRSRWNASAVQ